MRAALVLAALLALAAAAGSRPAAASPRDHLVLWCIEDVRLIPPRVRRLPIPVGCELVDCCPGCPGPGPLDWQVRVGGAPLASVGVHFEGLAPGPIEMEGDAMPAPGGAVVGPRGATLRGLSGAGGGVPVASLELGLDADVLAKLEQGPGGADRDLGEIAVSIEQRLGPVPVNEFRYKAVLRRCKLAPIPRCDVIVQHDNRGGDQSVIQLDGRRSSDCFDDELRRSDAVSAVGNVLSPDQACPSGELAVYSDDDAMWIEPSAGFTDTCGDEIPVRLAPVLRAPVSVWRAQTRAKRDPAPDLAHADLVFDDRNKVGVVFDAVTQDLSGNDAATLAAKAWCFGLPTLKLAGFYKTGRLNVYYSDFPTTGGVCPNDPNAIFVGTTANVATLAHEFGHTFTLEHTDNLQGFPADNLMDGGGPPTRHHLSLGQAFRVNVDDRSRLNANGVRSGHERSCAATGDCPKLEHDWSRP